MAKVNLTSGFVQSPPACPVGKVKVDYYDVQLPGFLLEVRATGNCTFYQRYRDKYGRTKQARIGHTTGLSLEEAKAKARQIQSQALMGIDLNLEQEKLKAMPDLALFFEEQYLPYVRLLPGLLQSDKASMPLFSLKAVSLQFCRPYSFHVCLQLLHKQ